MSFGVDLQDFFKMFSCIPRDLCVAVAFGIQRMKDILMTIVVQQTPEKKWIYQFAICNLIITHQ